MFGKREIEIRIEIRRVLGLLFYKEIETKPLHQENWPEEELTYYERRGFKLEVKVRR